MKFFKQFLGKTNEYDEYNDIYDNGDDNGIDYSELDENDDPEEIIDSIRGTVTRGDCILCNAKNAMTYDGFICFICSECGNSVHEDTYYRWIAGYPVSIED